MILMHIQERDVEAYYSQGWTVCLCLGHHGYWRRFIAELRS
jgi:hypothetical protein